MITSSHVIGPDMSYATPEHIQRVALDFPQLTIVVGHACWPWTTIRMFSPQTRWCPLSPLSGGEGRRSYAASAFAGFSGGVIAPEVLISATSLAE